MPLRLIKYKVAAIEDFLQGKPEDTLWPNVLCACFYHGKTSPYPYSTNVYDYFANAWLAREFGSFDRFYLFDLTVIKPEDMQKHGSLALMEQIFKYSQDQNFFNLLQDLLGMYKDTLLSLESPLGSDYWHAVYLVSHRILTKLGYGEEAVADLFSKSLNLSKSKASIMNVTQAIREEGREEGIQQERLGIARTMFQSGEPIERVARWTGLSETSIRSL